MSDTDHDPQPRPRSHHVVADFVVGEGVIYVPQYGPREDGVVTSLGKGVVFVRYRAHQVNGTATYPRDLFKLRREGSDGLD